MSKQYVIAGLIVLGLGAAGTVQAQTTTPPERMNGSSTTDNPATATTPHPGSPAAMSTPGTTSATTPPSLATPAAPGAINGAVSTSSENKPGAPVSGANSFTEGQARSRMEDRGFSQVSELKLDNGGVWRAKATKDGKTVTVALDYQGNVVAQ